MQTEKPLRDKALAAEHARRREAAVADEGRFEAAGATAGEEGGAAIGNAASAGISQEGVGAWQGLEALCDAVMPPEQTACAATLPSLQELEKEITGALQRGEFELFLQPQIALQTFSIAGAEVLLRWRHPQRGLILPGSFLPLAEATNQVGEIDRWVLRSACQNFLQWRHWMGQGTSLAVNVSPMEILDSRFLPNTLATLGSHRIPDAGVELELVETAVLANPELARETITCLRRNGIRMALDDFGVGYASLSSLRDYPFTKIKIDRSFVQHLMASERSRTIVRSMIELGRSLQLTVNAEGVETPEQLQFLFENGCDEVQGYLFARPMPAARFQEWTAGFLGTPQSASQFASNSTHPPREVRGSHSPAKVLAFSSKRSAI